MLFFVLTSLSAQESISVPLSNPSKPGLLKINIINGSISIKGTATKEVKITGIKKAGKYSYKKAKINKREREGLKRVSINSLEFSAREYDNTVRVESSPRGTTDFEIEIPKNFSLNISTINNGDIYVENINGTIDVSNINGKITMNGISGSVSADALNKDIKIDFVKVTPNVAMAFSSLNGDIDITFPKMIRADIKVKSDRGEIYTDFDLKAKASKPKVTRGDRKKGNAYSVKLEKWITGSINGGGAEILFKNFNGDVIIRSK